VKEPEFKLKPIELWQMERVWAHHKRGGNLISLNLLKKLHADERIGSYERKVRCKAKA
jgi:hypothetical protein